MNRSVLMAFFVVGLLTEVGTAAAQPIGTFNWQPAVLQ